MKRVLALVPFALLALAVPASAGGGGCFDLGQPASEAATTNVTIDHACFNPGAARVAVGDTVVFWNASGLPHNISGPGIDYFDLPDGVKHPVAFEKAGLYPYACMLHPGMSGVVVVGAVAPAAVQTAVASAAAVQPVASTTSDDGGTSYLPWLLGGTAVLVAAGVVVTSFVRRESGVALPAR